MIPYFIPDMPCTDRLIPYLKEIESNCWYTNFGPLYHRFKRQIANACLSGIDEDRITLVSSGTASIELSLRTLNLPHGSNILTTGFTFPATIHAIKNVGLNPILCDIDPGTWQLNPNDLYQHIKQHDIAAIIPVAAFGVPVDSSSWAKLSNNTGIPVIVDAAAALSSQSIHSDLTYAFSLHATKPIGVGEGGLVVFPSPSQSIICKKISNFGIEPDRNISMIGANAKLSEYHCAVGLAQLGRLDSIRTNRQGIFDYYKSKLLKLGNINPLQKGNDQSPPASLYVTFKNLESKVVNEKLYQKEIETRLLYQPIISELTAYKDKIAITSNGLNVAQRVARHGLALPFHSHLSTSDIDYIVDAIADL
jgi:dTDP-4-amino-4,6-dideoxygalactose transaminase